MKKFLSIFLGFLIGAAAITAIYRVAIRKTFKADAPLSDQVVSILEQNDCFVCHSQEPALPFYAKLPVIREMIQGHITHGSRFVDLKAGTADMDNVSEVTLSMIEYAACEGNMPVLGYRMMHWGTGLNSNERSVLASWVLQKRGYHEPVCPIPDQIAFDAGKAALGEAMFNDTRLSLDGTISCATCHVLEIGGADYPNERVSEGIDGLTGNVNAPTVFNSFYQIRQFWNGRAADLSEQAAGPMTNPVEMGDQTLEQVVERLSKDRALVAQFKTLYPEEGLTANTLTACIAEFEKSLITPGSRFDKYLLGDEHAISDMEEDGYEEFKENACATCHTGVLLGGKSFEHLDVFGNYFADRTPDIPFTSDDEGLKGFTGNAADLYKFKVPTLRNVEMTAPYFHDGSVATLEEAVMKMAKYELGKTLDAEDVAEIAAFMRSLTGQSKYFK